MRPNQKLIDGLKIAADRIEDPFSGYIWSFPSSCNCGILAQVLLDISEKELTDILKYVPISNWSRGICYMENAAEHNIEEVCQLTGFNMRDVYNTLKSYGLDNQDFETLEFLGQTTEVKYYKTTLSGRVNNSWSFDDPHVVAQYFRKLADDLEKLLPLYSTTTTVSTKKETVLVAVGEI